MASMVSTLEAGIVVLSDPAVIGMEAGLGSDVTQARDGARATSGTRATSGAVPAPGPAPGPGPGPVRAGRSTRRPQHGPTRSDLLVPWIKAAVDAAPVAGEDLPLAPAQAVVEAGCPGLWARAAAALREDLVDRGVDLERLCDYIAQRGGYVPASVQEFLVRPARMDEPGYPAVPAAVPLGAEGNLVRARSNLGTRIGNRMLLAFFNGAHRLAGGGH